MPVKTAFASGGGVRHRVRHDRTKGSQNRKARSKDRAFIICGTERNLSKNSDLPGIKAGRERTGQGGS